MPMPRLFVAVEVSPPVRASMVELQQQLGAARLAATWSAPESLHITLVFLGSTNATLVPALTTALGKVAAGIAPFELTLGSVDAFPNVQAARVVWCGVVPPATMLRALQAQTAAALEPLGFAPEDRAYTPHITLGYATKHASNAERARIGAALGTLAAPVAHQWTVSEIVLFESVHQASATVYVPRATIPLATNALAEQPGRTQ